MAARKACGRPLHLTAMSIPSGGVDSAKISSDSACCRPVDVDGADLERLAFTPADRRCRREPAHPRMIRERAMVETVIAMTRAPP